MAKEFKFRGKTLDELNALDVREFAKYLKSRMRRSVLRKFDVIENFIKDSQKKIANNKPIRTHYRNIIIMPKMVGWTVLVHNGKEFFPVKINQDMLGHRLGEFALTRRKVEHGSPGIGATKSSASLSVK